MRVMPRSCYLFAGGATGGHLTPGLAVAAELALGEPDCRIVFLGSDRPLEQRLVASAGFEHRALPVEPSAVIYRNPLRFAWKSWRAFRQARALLRAEQPRAVIGLGGFACVPTVQAAIWRQIPVVLLEQNSVPGRATRLFSRRAAAVCTSFDVTTGRLPSDSRVELTGNPVRAAITELCRQEQHHDSAPPPTLLVLGGSQGAESLNDLVSRMLVIRLPHLKGWRVVHQTGASQQEQIEQRYRTAGLAHVVESFFDDLAAWYRQATLVISRAGATTLAELACAGCPAVLLPYPFATDNHQAANAQIFQDAGAAVVMEQPAEGNCDGLAAAVAGLAEDPVRRADMQRAMRSLARPDAARKVCQVLQSLQAVPMT
jgi:UDP-N-acetylglucosamine--N-acetylmuramyl-(pentapeptide) pyrophosphoryl-undecaprenol N-acetylglucosamine transferase